MLLHVSVKAIAAALVLACACASACERDGADDTVTDLGLPASVWNGDAAKIQAVLPKAVTTFKPSEAAMPFTTSYRTGPVFGASCAYADGSRGLVIRVEGGNLRERYATLAKGHANAGESFVTRETLVHGQKAVVHWNATGRTADVVYALNHKLVVELRLVPAQSDEDVVQLADAMDVGPLSALALDGVK
jgi:hypothetical protein